MTPDIDDDTVFVSHDLEITEDKRLCQYLPTYTATLWQIEKTYHRNGPRVTKTTTRTVIRTWVLDPNKETTK